MPNLAQITLVGHLGRDPEGRYTPSGEAVAEFSVAHTYKRKAGETTTWWRCTAFGKTAEIASQFLTKGDAVLVIGTAYNEPWQDKQGNDRLTLKVMVDRIVLLGKRAERATTDDQTKQPEKKTPTPSTSPNPFSDFDDDVPY